MNPNFLFALFVFCQDYQSGQTSRLYRILCRLTRYRISLSDRAYAAIRRGKDDPSGEWEEARCFYRELKRSKYAKG